MSEVQAQLQESFAEAMQEESKTECVICLNAGDDSACVRVLHISCMHARCILADHSGLLERQSQPWR